MNPCGTWEGHIVKVQDMWHINENNINVTYMNVGSCHHGMARPQVADGGTASDMEGSCE
jgi:hypothetical protein